MTKSIASERIAILFDRAEKKASENRKDLADRYVELARKIGMKSQETIPKSLQRKFCRNCKSYIRPGENARVRMSSEKTQIITCKKCGEIKRYSLED